MLPRDVGKTAGHIRTAYENNTFNLRPDRRQRRADIGAAIEKGEESCLRDRLPRRGDERYEPTRANIAAGIRCAGENDRSLRRRGSP